MAELGELPGLLPDESGQPAASGPASAMETRTTGVLPYQRLLAMVRSGALKSLIDIETDQIQPASLDLRLGRNAYRVRASFLPGRNSTVMERVKELDGLPPIDLENGAVLERGAVYVVEVAEAVRLNQDTYGVANPKSSTGRLDILTQLIADRATAFDFIERGYEGPLFLEVAPLSFSIVVRPGVRLSQIRLQRDHGAVGTALSQGETEKLYREGQLVGSPSPLSPLRDGVMVPLSVDLEGAGRGSIVGYKAKKNASRIDLERIAHYDPRDFWEKIESADGRINLDKDDFYILATREDVGVPAHTAAEMVPYDTRSGEFRVHYAGFFDPGFGVANGKAAGSRSRTSDRQGLAR